MLPPIKKVLIVVVDSLGQGYWLGDETQMNFTCEHYLGKAFNTDGKHFAVFDGVGKFILLSLYTEDTVKTFSAVKDLTETQYSLILNKHQISVDTQGFVTGYVSTEETIYNPQMKDYKFIDVTLIKKSTNSILLSKKNIPREYNSTGWRVWYSDYLGKSWPAFRYDNPEPFDNSMSYLKSIWGILGYPSNQGYRAGPFIIVEMLSTYNGWPLWGQIQATSIYLTKDNDLALPSNAWMIYGTFDGERVSGIGGMWSLTWPPSAPFYPLDVITNDWRRDVKAIVLPHDELPLPQTEPWS